MKIASFCVPHHGGTYAVARSLRAGLASHSIELRWLGVGRRGWEAWNDPAQAGERHYGEIVARDTMDEREQAAAVLRHLHEMKYDGVIIDVLGGAFTANLARFLPPHFVRLLLVHSITVGTYAYARAIRDYVHGTVAVSPRIEDDLVHQYGFLPDRTCTIPNAVDFSLYDGLPPKPLSRTLRLIFLGRVDDASKGVFWLPEILRQVRPLKAALTLAGDGPGLTELQQRLLTSEMVEFTGAVKAECVPGLLSRHDVLLMPSRYEGFGMVIVEAMAAGCVPVASLIQGVTDNIIQHGQTGFLFPIGNTAAASKSVSCLAQDRALLARMSQAAFQAVRNRFGLPQAALTYAALLRTIGTRLIAPPLPLHTWSYPWGLRQGLRSCLPQPFKLSLNLLREKIRLRRSRVLPASLPET